MPERIPNGVGKKVVFRAIASTDHFTPATGKTIAITISKNGATSFSNPAAGATNATEMASGFYKFDLGTGDCDTNGPLAWRAAGTGVDDIGDVYEVVAATNGGFSALPAVASGSAGAVITSGTGTAQLSTSSGQVLLQTGTGTGQLNFTSGVVSANVTQFGGSAGTFASGLPAVNASYIGGVPVTATTSITFPAASTIATTTGAVGSVTGAVGSVTGLTASNLDAAISSRMASYTQPTGFLAATFPTGTVASTTNITAGTITTTTNLTNAATAGDFTATQKASITSAVPTAATIAGATWDVTLASHLTAGTTGYALNAAGAAGDPWSTALPGAYSAGSAGYIVGTNIDAAISSVSGLNAAGVRAAVGLASANLDTQLGAIVTDTAEIGTAGAGLTALASAADLATAQADLDTITGSDGVTLATAQALYAPNKVAPLDAAATRAAVGLASANLDTQLGDLPTNAELGTALGTADDAVLAVLGSPAGASLAADVAAVKGDTAASRAYADHTVVRGTAGTGTTPSTTQFTPSALSPAGVAADQFKGRILVFDNDTTTTALRGQATDITASSAAGLPLLTFTALTTAPSSGDTFSIL